MKMYREKIRDKKKVFVTISWDDGAVYDLKILELLDKYSLRGSFYIPQRYLKKTLKKKEIKEISKSQEIGAHSLSHPDLTKLSLKRLRQEVGDSKKYLEDITSQKVSMFSYPFGQVNRRVKNEVKSAGFLGAKSRPVPNETIMDPFELRPTIGTIPLSKKKVSFYRSLLKDSISPNREKTPCLKKDYLRWTKAVIFTLENAREKGYVWHLSGHSWEVEYFNMWDYLEKIFRYIYTSNHFVSLTNSELIKRLAFKF